MFSYFINISKFFYLIKSIVKFFECCYMFYVNNKKHYMFIRIMI